MSTPDPLEVFQEAVGQVSAGDLDAVMEYYEPDAVFVDPTGVTIQGRDAIRAVMGEYLGLKPTLTVNKVRKLIETPDIALLSADWTMTGANPDGSALELTGNNVDVFRRQPDGSWRLAIDNPYGV